MIEILRTRIRQSFRKRKNAPRKTETARLGKTRDIHARLITRTLIRELAAPRQRAFRWILFRRRDSDQATERAGQPTPLQTAPPRVARSPGSTRSRGKRHGRNHTSGNKAWAFGFAPVRAPTPVSHLHSIAPPTRSPDGANHDQGPVPLYPPILPRRHRLRNHGFQYLIKRSETREEPASQRARLHIKGRATRLTFREPTSPTKETGNWANRHGHAGLRRTTAST